MSEDLVGRQLGKYRLVERVGAGGMACVYRGIQVGLEREVAVKVLPRERAHDRELLRRFRRESQATAKLAHPNIVTIYDSGEQEGHHFYVMEYLKADSLERVLEREGTLPSARVTRITQEILKALVYTHDKDILHRDLKPANIRFDLRENAIVTDFGLVKDLGETAITLTGAALGTPRYMSPEQVRGDEIDGRSDLYQVGLMMHEALTGILPREGRAVWPIDVSGELRALVEQAIEADPDARFATAKEMLHELRRVELRDKARRLCEGSTTVETRAVSLQVDTRTPSTMGMETSGPSSDSIWASSIAAILESAEDRQEALRLIVRMSPAVVLGVVLVLWGWRPVPPVPPMPAPKPPEIRVFNVAIDEQVDHVILSWDTNLRTVGHVRYGTDERQLDEMVAAPTSGGDTMHMVVVQGLAPGSEYWFRIDSRDPEGRAAPHLSELTSFVTRERIARDSTESLVPLVKSYIDKLTRMTPDERAKLKDSIGKFGPPQGDITAEEKKELVATRTDPAREEQFHTRVRSVRNWIAALKARGHDVGAMQDSLNRILKLSLSNLPRAADALDRLIAELDRLEVNDTSSRR